MGVGLLLIVVSASIGSVPPWLLRSAIDGIRNNAPLFRLVQLAAGTVGLAIIAGAMRSPVRRRPLEESLEEATLAEHSTNGTIRP